MTATGLSQPEVEEVLQRYGELTRLAIDRHLARDDSNPWLDDLVVDYPRRPGKALRPAILAATCQAFGGTLHESLGAAVSIELLHNAFLVHDDIEDDSELRRGDVTLHRRHGIPLALNAGDALAVLALEPLLNDRNLSNRLRQHLSVEFLTMARQTIDGQATELGWRQDVNADVRPADYLEMVGRKSCSYTTIYPLRAGAMIGARGSFGLADLTRFGYLLGAAFQIRDDLLDLFGSVDRFGKKRYGDIREGKRTLMLIHLLRNVSGEERSWLLGYLKSELFDRTDEAISTVVEMMYARGSVDFAVEYGRGIGAASYDAFDAAFHRIPQSPHRDFLRGLVGYMLNRDM